ncbi:MAG TPA: ArsR family transcriptional regulator [candidate division WOR-3 bacterium]|uniref:ArsR family transcriptional regulator n=1 Tax=candidate division WOR-3 bacterium TaxID=2052148 RepID=A0A7C0VBN7_UNCW3|nr:ArsR family transcriptional regulator [candidate division WOR-3 bacterium]
MLYLNMHKYANIQNPLFKRRQVFRALACEHRLEILEILRYGTHTVTEVAGFLGLHPSVVSRHLYMLFSSGLLSMEKKGNEVFYSLREPELITELFEIVDKIGR